MTSLWTSSACHLHAHASVELRKQVSCSLQLTNKTDEQELNECNVEFVGKTTSPKKYCVRPNNGIVPPRSTADVFVTMQAQLDAPLDMQCKEVTPKDITGDMFTKESGNVVDEVKLKVVDVTPSSQTEGSEDGSPGSLSYQETSSKATRCFASDARHCQSSQGWITVGDRNNRRQINYCDACCPTRCGMMCIALTGIWIWWPTGKETRLFKQHGENLSD
ncbi:hypothetical protein EJB05_30214, partial [Eragrostis curvula]